MTIKFEMVNEDDALVNKVKETILADIAASGSAGVYRFTCVCLGQVPGIDHSTADTKVKLALDSLLEDGLIEGKEVKTVLPPSFGYTAYSLTDTYYSSEYNPNNYQD